MKRTLTIAAFLVLLITAYKFSIGDPLTTDEKAYLRSLHIGGDINRVRIHRNTWLAQHISPGIRWGTVIPAIPYHVFTVSSDEYSGDYLPCLAHEFTHIVTTQKGLPATSGRYAYDGQQGLLSHHFSEFNSEQQASIVEDYARLRDSGANVSLYRTRIDELASMPDRPLGTTTPSDTLLLMAARIYVASQAGKTDTVTALADK